MFSLEKANLKYWLEKLKNVKNLKKNNRKQGNLLDQRVFKKVKLCETSISEIQNLPQNLPQNTVIFWEKPPSTYSVI